MKPQDDAAGRLMALVNLGSLSMAACVAADLRLADLLGAGPRDVESLALETATHAPSLRRLLRALTALGLCEQGADERFALRPDGELLRADHPRSLRAWLLWWGRYMWPVWGHLLHSVKTGESARPLLTGVDGFQHLDKDPAAAAIFNRAMAEFTRLVADEFVRRYDLSPFRRIVDVGGGHGALLAAVLAAAADARGVLVDLTHAVGGAARHLAAAGMADRSECIAGDFFRAVPEGGDLYLLKAVLHDWEDEAAIRILASCRRAIAAHGRLAIVERVLPDRLSSSPHDHALARADLNMLVALGARERSEAEFVRLLREAGFRLSRRIDTALEYSILEALPL
jgi:hypothetical protein